MIENTFTSWAERERLSLILLENIKAGAGRIVEMAARFSDDEFDCYYRLYHSSFKVFGRQQSIRNAVALFESFAPEGKALNSWFKHIVDEGLAQTFEMKRTNQNWLPETLPVVQAWSHCHAFLKALSWSAHNLQDSPQLLPDGWALALYLYDCR